jgi:hypothetical protein
MDTENVRSLLGLFLADGRLERLRGPVRPQVRGILDGGVGEKDFLQEKVDELLRSLPATSSRIQPPEIRPYQTSVRDNGRSTTVLRFRVADTRLHLIYNLLYPARQRRITSQVLELVGGRAGAWLWAENAKERKQGWVLKRVGQTAEEALLVRDWLQLLTGAAGELIQQGVTPRLLFKDPQATLLRGSLLPYAPASRRHLFVPAP